MRYYWKTNATKKQEAYIRWLSTRNPEHRQSYKREEAVFKRMTRANKNTTWNAKCRETDSYIGGSNRTKIQPNTINT